MKNVAVTGLGIGLLITTLCQAQSSTKKPESLNFTEVWVWEYPDADGKTREMAIYRHPKKNYWLFTPEAFGQSDEMTEWILAKGNGEYIQRYRDEDGQDKTMYHTLQFNTSRALPAHYLATGASQTYGEKSYGFPELKGKAYEVRFEKSTDQALYYLAEVKKNMQPVYSFNRLNTEARLPVFFPTDLPANRLVLEERARAGSKSIWYRFRFVSHTEYYIRL